MFFLSKGLLFCVFVCFVEFYGAHCQMLGSSKNITASRIPSVKLPKMEDIIGILDIQNKEEIISSVGWIYDIILPFYSAVMYYIAVFLNGVWFKILIILTVLSLFWKLVGRVIYHYICWILCRLIRAGTNTYAYHYGDYYGDF